MLNEDVDNVVKILSELEPLEGVQGDKRSNREKTKVMVRSHLPAEWECCNSLLENRTNMVPLVLREHAFRRTQMRVITTYAQCPSETNEFKSQATKAAFFQSGKHLSFYKIPTVE